MALVDIIGGTRPNFVKIAALLSNERLEIRSSFNEFKFRFVHTGQHYDDLMSGVFLRQLGLPSPDENINAGSGTQAEQTARIMVGYEEILSRKLSDMCLVFGDVNSTLACAITAKKAGITLGHIEGGIRSGDMTMPEEVNRVVVDSITDYFFTTSMIANENLYAAGVQPSRVFFVGNTMIDTLKMYEHKLKMPNFANSFLTKEKNYIVLTLHRPSNVDSVATFKNIIYHILDATKDEMIIFPAHPRIAKALKAIDLNDERFLIIDPLPYLEFNKLVSKSMCVLTDSGGISEETTYFKVPCITLRDSTERPETVATGTNILIGKNYDKIGKLLSEIRSKKWKRATMPEKWDGNSAIRVMKIIDSLLR